MFTQSYLTPHNRDTNKKLVKIIHSLLEMDETAPFRKPVPHKALGLGDYKKIVKKPIDLNLIRRHNNESKYKTIEEALDDIELCWENCKLYNHASSQVYQQALKLERIFLKMVHENFPEIYAATESKIKQIEAHVPIIAPNQNKNHQSIYEGSQSEHYQKQSKQAMLEDGGAKIVTEHQPDESHNVNSKMQDESPVEEINDNKSQKSSVKQQKQPILVNLRERPTSDQIRTLSAQMKLIEDKNILEQVLQILFMFEKENLVAGPKSQMQFRMENIHLSTYYRICKIIKYEPEEALEIIE